ncbi:MAG: carboxypeptidase-like regulatory domain-containing protein [Bryobacteraceae bacterium]
MKLSGKAIDGEGVPVPGVCVGLFTEGDHRLIIANATGPDGDFKLGEVPKGRYRLVAKCEAFGAANARVRIGRGATSVILKMRPAGIDTTSFIELK